MSMITELRRELQSTVERVRSDWTRDLLQEGLRRSRDKECGIAIGEIAEVIREALPAEEVDALRKLL